MKKIDALKAAKVQDNKLQNSTLKNFIRKYTGITKHDESYYCKMLVTIFESKRLKLLLILNQRIFIFLMRQLTLKGDIYFNVFLEVM